MSRIFRTLLLVSCCFMSGALSAQSTAPPKAPDSIAIDGETFQLAAWQLPQDHFVAAKMPIRLVHPRPDSETNAWARHRKAYPGIEYRIPVSVQGGAYPFHYEILEGPPGMRIGGQFGVADYGIVSWVPEAENASYPVRIRITDQELNYVETKFNVSVTTRGFVFVDPNAPEGGDGSISAPLRRFSQLHDNNNSEGTRFAGQIAYLRGGRHQTKDNGTGNYLELRADRNPAVILGYPGEYVELDATNAGIHIGGGASGDDFFASGFTMKNSPPSRPNSRFLSFWNTSGNRSTMFEMAFENHVAGTEGNDNAHQIHYGAQDGWTDYVTFWSLKFRNYEKASIGSTYQTRYVVVEDCVFGFARAGASPNAAVFMKQDSTFWSLRRNVSIEQSFRSGTLLQYGSDRKSPPHPQLVEMCYNILRGGTVVHSIWSPGSTAYGHKDNTTWIYRNTLIGSVSGTDLKHNRMIFDSNVYLTDRQHYLPSEGLRVVVVGDDLTGTLSEAGSMLGADFRLNGSHRERHFGAKGHEILH
jgi:hypothetical protein